MYIFTMECLNSLVGKVESPLIPHQSGLRMDQHLPMLTESHREAVE